MIQLILRSLQYRKGRVLALALSVMLSTGLLFSVFLLREGLLGGLGKDEDRLGADLLVVPAKSEVAPGEILYGGAPQNIYMPAELVPEIQQMAGVSRAAGQFFTQTLTEDCCDVGESLRLVGIDSTSDWVSNAWRKGNSTAQPLKPDEILVGSKVASANLKHLFILGKLFRVAGVLEVSGTGLDSSILMDIKIARQLAKTTPQLQESFAGQENPDTLVSAVLVKLEPAASQAVVQQRIRSLGDVQVFSAAETRKHIQREFTVLLGLLFGISGFAAAVCIFQLFVGFYEQVHKRQGEWGLYLAMGLEPSRLALLVWGEAVSICSVGSLGGLAAGVFFYRYGLAFMENYEAFPFLPPSVSFSLFTGFALFLGFILLGTLAALLPAYKSSRLSPGIVMTRSDFS
jgi:putative ABC transport system permease protein